MSNGKHVLVIEDHEDSREVLTRLLKRSGFAVSAYDRCKPAEKHLEACDLDIALLDVGMPDRLGDNFGRELRLRCPKTMIVFVTGEPLVEPLKGAVPDCFVLRKPVDSAVLLQLLACFTSAKGYDTAMRKEIGAHARPGKM